MKRPYNGSTIKQIKFAEQLIDGRKSRRQIALDVGYSQSVADKAVQHIEKADGTQIALAKLYGKAGNVTMQAMSELSRRGFDEFTNKDLINAIKVMVNAFDKLQKKDETVIKVQNNLKQVFMQTQEAVRKEKVIDAETHTSESVDTDTQTAGTDQSEGK